MSDRERWPAESLEALDECREVAAKLIRTLETVRREKDPRKARQLLGTISSRTSKYMTGRQNSITV